MAIYSYLNNTTLDSFFDTSHIAEKGGNPNLTTTYKLNVNMYFAALTNKGYGVQGSSTNKEETNKMITGFYNILDNDY